MASNFYTCLSMAAALMLTVQTALAERITVAATVNDEVITSLELNERRALMLANTNQPDTEETRQRMTPRVMQMLVDEKLQMQEARRLSIEISDEEVAKAIDALGTPSQPPGAVKQQIETQGLSVRSLRNQVRAQLAWNKVVQRKLRRNVTITQDELERAQQAQAADPGTQEMRLAVLALAMTGPEQEAATLATANAIATELQTGKDLAQVAEKYRTQPNVQFSPQLWITEDRTPPQLMAELKQRKPNETIGPVRTGNILQFIKILEQRVTKIPPNSTEVLIKQILFDQPPKGDRAQAEKLAQSIQILAQNPGSCEKNELPPTPQIPVVSFNRITFATLNDAQRLLISRLSVGEVSDPQLLPEKVQMVHLCERLESAGKPEIDETLRQQIFGEKIELEAQKHLRNLRRDATTDIRTEQPNG